MAINILVILVINNKPKRVFLGARRTILQERAQLGAKNIKRVEYLKHWKWSGITNNKLGVAQMFNY